jgi:hypothetical protein
VSKLAPPLNWRLCFYKNDVSAWCNFYDTEEEANTAAILWFLDVQFRFVD